MSWFDKLKAATGYIETPAANTNQSNLQPTEIMMKNSKDELTKLNAETLAKRKEYVSQLESLGAEIREALRVDKKREASYLAKRYAGLSNLLNTADITLAGISDKLNTLETAELATLSAEANEALAAASTRSSATIKKMNKADAKAQIAEREMGEMQQIMMQDAGKNTLDVKDILDQFSQELTNEVDSSLPSVPNNTFLNLISATSVDLDAPYRPPPIPKPQQKNK